MKFKNKKAGFVSLGWIIMALIAIPTAFSSEDDTPPAAESSYAVTATSESKAEAEKKAKEKAEQEAAKESREEAARVQESQEQEAKKKAEAEEAARIKAEQEAAEKAAAQAKEVETAKQSAQATAPSVPAGETYVVVNDNIPYFTNEDLSSTEAWESYGELDEWYRVTAANALLGVELMPAEERGDISEVIPTGWQQAEYDIVSGGWLYNRAHLIGHQLTGEDANERNLMTGTRWFNVEGMLPFENFVANYIEETENHVRYRVTPYFEGENLLASGVFMEGFSIEDNGEGLKFNIYVPNIQPGVVIDYATGASWLENPPVVEEPVYEEPVYEEPAYVAPAPTEPAGGDISWIDTNGNGTVTIAEAKAAGFAMPIYSDHWLYPYMIDRDGDGMVGE